MVLAVAEHFHSHRDFFRIIIREWSGLRLPKRASFLARRAAARSLFTRVLRQGARSGEFRNLDAPAAADMVLGMVRSLVRFGDPRMTPDQIAKLVLDVFLNGIRNTSHHGKESRRS